MMMYYENKIERLKALFGDQRVTVAADNIAVGDRRYPVIDDVIVLLDPAQYPPMVRERLGAVESGTEIGSFAEDIQFTFGEEWKTYSEIVPEHKKEFEDYFDIVDIEGLAAATVCDLGCGIGRWSWFLRGRCEAQILVDFSEAIFVARKNMADADNAMFFMGDLTRLPFVDDFCDFLFCLGVLHHLPLDALETTRSLKRFSPQLLIYLYYALDNRPPLFRLLLSMATGVRKAVCRVRSPLFRETFSTLGAIFIYKPFVLLGHFFDLVGAGKSVPLYEGYKGKSVGRIKQDVYDRFFTRIEQRVSRAEIEGLRDTYDKVTVSEKSPYWHFRLER